MFYALILIGSYFTADALMNPQPVPEPQPQSPVVQQIKHPCDVMNCDGIVDWDGSPLE